MNRFLKYIPTVVFIISPVLIKAQEINFTIKGKVAALSAPAKAYLVYSEDAVQHADSVVLTNGQFTFKGHVSEPVNALLLVNAKGDGMYNGGNDSYTELYLEQAPITIESPDVLKRATITGGSINADNNRLNAALQPYQEKLQTLTRARKALSPEEATKETLATYDQQTAALRKQMDSLLEDFIKNNPNSMVSFFVLKRYATAFPKLSTVVPLFNQLSPDVRATKQGVQYAAVLERLKTLDIGATAPEFSQADTAGKLVALRDFRGKYVLIDFWASWCGPCRRENPNVVKAYAKYKDKGFAIVGVSLDRPGTKDKWLKAIHDDNLSWTQVSDFNYFKNAAAVLYAVQAIPQNYLIDKDGKIMAKNLRGDALEEKLAEIFDGK